MKFNDVKLSFLIGWTSWLIGVATMANASETSNLKWVNIRDSVHKMQVSFPKKPLELSFDLPFRNTPKTGSLHIYSVPMDNGLLALSVLESPLINEEAFQEKTFKQNFDSLLVKYLFYDPQQFHQNQSFKSTRDEFQGIPILSFQFDYHVDRETRLIKGVAIVKDQVLYHLFYIASKDGYDDELLREFVGSFQL